MEATKASLIRAVRARRTALLAVFPFRLLGFAALSSGGVAFFATVLPAGVACFAVALPAAVGFAVFFAAFFVVEEAESADAVAESPEDCPATGSTTISMESKPARQRAAKRETELWENADLISSLYAAFDLDALTRNHSRYRKRRKAGLEPLCFAAIGTPFGTLPRRQVHLFTDHKRSPQPVPADFSHPRPMSIIQPIAGELEPHPDVALIERVRGGDVSAYDTLVRKYERQVFRISQHITQNREDAEDAMQDAFLKAYEKLEQFQGNSKFYTWLVRIAVNESLMRLRKRRTGKMVSIDEDIATDEGSVPRDLADWAPDPEQNYGQAELAEILRKTIQGLPQGFRIVFVLRDVEGLSTEETAETLGLSIPAVKSRLLRARLQLRERLSRYFHKKKGPTESRLGEARSKK